MTRVLSGNQRVHIKICTRITTFDKSAKNFGQTYKEYKDDENYTKFTISYFSLHFLLELSEVNTFSSLSKTTNRQKTLSSFFTCAKIPVVFLSHVQCVLKKGYLLKKSISPVGSKMSEIICNDA